MALVLSKQDILRKPPLGTQINSGHPLAKGLVGAWLMNEGGGGKVYDITGNNNTGTLSAVTWPAGNVGVSTGYNGSSSNIDCGRVTKIEGAANLTVSLWCKPSALTQNLTICAKWNYSTQGTFGFQQYQSQSAGDIKLFIATSPTDPGTGYGEETTFQPLKAGQWNHVLFTFTGGTGATIYVNGKSGAQSRIGSPPSTLTSATADFILGEFQGLGRWWSGSLDNCLVYNRALSPSEIRQLYAQPFAFMRQPRIILPDTPPLVNTGTRFWFGITF